MKTASSTMSHPITSPQLSIEVRDPQLGKLGYVVVDRPVHISASGGVRFSPDVSVSELTALARAMTYKWAFINTPLGGAKAGICADPAKLGCDRATLMEAFGRAIAPLVRRHLYLPGIDLGTTLDDLRAIMRGAGQPLPETQIDGSRCTALTVFETIRQVLTLHQVSLRGLTVALEGFGKVASVVGNLLAEAGAKIVAVSTVQGALIQESGLDMTLLLTLREEYGDALVHHYPSVTPQAVEGLISLPVTLLVPGARPWLIREDNWEQVQARFVIPISNAPITHQAEAALVKQGKIIITDFVANCGGILASAMLSQGFDMQDASWLVQHDFATLVADIQQLAWRKRISFGEAARAVAWERHLALNDGQRSSANSSWQRLNRAWGKQGPTGIGQRVAWRIFRRWPKVGGAVRRAALKRYAELSVGVTGEVVSAWLRQEDSTGKV